MFYVEFVEIVTIKLIKLTVKTVSSMSSISSISNLVTILGRIDIFEVEIPHSLCVQSDQDEFMSVFTFSFPAKFV